MTAVIYTPHFIQFFDANGDPLSNGKLYTYSAGTTTPKATYTTEEATVEQANPIILDSAGRATIFIQGSYRFDLFDSDDVLIRSTDDVTSFTTLDDAGEAFFQSFSGDGETTSFTLTESLGTDEKGIMVFTPREYATNGDFSTDTDWTKGTGWTITGGEAVATGAISTAIEQTAGQALVSGTAYNVEFTITRSAGSITANIGGTAGTARSASGTYDQTIFAGSTQTISFTTSGFTGTLDNVTVRNVEGQVILNPNEYTVNGTSLIFSFAPPTGTNNIQVWAPTKLLGAASAAAAAAEAAQTAAVAAKNEAEAAAGLLDIASTTSVAIGTGSKSFTITAGLGLTAGQFVLIDSDADGSNYMYGQITSYSGTTLQVNVLAVGGSGTFADWTITLIGLRGLQGATGTVSGAAAATLDITADEMLFLDNSDADGLSKGTLPIASQAEAEAGTATDKLMTPQRTGQAIAELATSGWVPLQTQTVSSAVASVDFTSNIDSTYKAYAVAFTGVRKASGTNGLLLRFSDDGGSTFESTTDYDWNFTQSQAGGSGVAEVDAAGDTSIRLGVNGSTDAGQSIAGEVIIAEPNASSLFTQCFYETYGGTTSGVFRSGNGGGVYAVASTINGFQIFDSGANITDGTFTLYGIAGA